MAIDLIVYAPDGRKFRCSGNISSVGKPQCISITINVNIIILNIIHRPVTGIVHMVRRIIKAIGKQVGSNERTGIHHHIGVDEPGNHRVIVPALEVIESCLGIVVISPVTEGVPRSHAAGGGGKDAATGSS